MSKLNEFVSYVVELMQSVGPVEAKRMFGGYGVFLEGLMFALIADEVLYLKADKTTVEDFQALDLEAFTYMKKGKPCVLQYYQAPEHTLEDVEAMTLWADRAYKVAQRAARKK